MTACTRHAGREARFALLPWLALAAFVLGLAPGFASARDEDPGSVRAAIREARAVVQHAWITAVDLPGKGYVVDPCQGHVRALRLPTFEGEGAVRRTVEAGNRDGNCGNDLRYFETGDMSPRYEYFTQR